MSFCGRRSENAGGKQIVRTIYSFTPHPQNTWMRGIKSVHILDRATLIWHGLPPKIRGRRRGEKQTSDKCSEYFFFFLLRFVCCTKKKSCLTALHAHDRTRMFSSSTPWPFKEKGKKGPPSVPLALEEKSTSGSGEMWDTDQTFTFCARSGASLSVRAATQTPTWSQSFLRFFTPKTPWGFPQHDYWQVLFSAFLKISFFKRQRTELIKKTTHRITELWHFKVGIARVAPFCVSDDFVRSTWAALQRWWMDGWINRQTYSIDRQMHR